MKKMMVKKSPKTLLQVGINFFFFSFFPLSKSKHILTLMRKPYETGMAKWQQCPTFFLQPLWLGPPEVLVCQDSPGSCPVSLKN